MDVYIISKLIKNHPANDSEILEVKNLLVVKLPNVYKDLLKQLEGFQLMGD